MHHLQNKSTMCKSTKNNPPPSPSAVSSSPSSSSSSAAENGINNLNELPTRHLAVDAMVEDDNTREEASRGGGEPSQHPDRIPMKKLQVDYIPRAARRRSTGTTFSSLPEESTQQHDNNISTHQLPEAPAKLPDLPFGPPPRSWRSPFTSGSGNRGKICRRMSSEF